MVQFPGSTILIHHFFMVCPPLEPEECSVARSDLPPPRRSTDSRARSNASRRLCSPNDSFGAANDEPELSAGPGVQASLAAGPPTPVIRTASGLRQVFGADCEEDGP